MAHLAPFAESDFDSIHSSQAFVGDHQVMYTPPLRTRKPSRFASNQSYILPDIPNTSQIVGDGAGELPQVRRTNNNQNQIVNALMRMQQQLDQAKTTIRELMRERDECRGECKALRQLLVQTQRAAPHKAANSKATEQVDDELFDLTQYSDADDDFTQQLPPLNLPKPKSSLKNPTNEQQLPERKRSHEQPVSREVRASQSQQRQPSNTQQNQPLEYRRAPLREMSESQCRQRSQQSPQKAGKKVVIEEEFTRDLNQNTQTAQTNRRASTRNLTYLSNIPSNQPFTALRNQLEADRLSRQYSKSKPAETSDQQETARSLRAATAPPLEHEAIPGIEEKDLTAASNTSRRRRRASDTADVDDNMTSAYIIPDITVAKPQQQSQPNAETAPISSQPQPGHLSDEAKNFLHSMDPNHIVSCVHCRRLLRLPEKLQVRKEAEGWDWCMVFGDK